MEWVDEWIWPIDFNIKLVHYASLAYQMIFNLCFCIVYYNKSRNFSMSRVKFNCSIGRRRLFQKVKDMHADNYIGFPIKSIHSALYIHDKFVFYRESVHWLSVWEFQNLWLCHALSQQAHACLEWRPMEKRITLFVNISYKFTLAWVFCFFKHLHKC